MTGAPLHRCVICGETEPLGLDLCVACGGAPDNSGSKLVFLERGRSRAQRTRATVALRAILGQDLVPADISLLASGHRALVRVRPGIAERVVGSLEARGVRAVVKGAAVPTTLPGSFRFLLAAILVVGLWTATYADPLYFITTPPMTVGLWFAAQLRMRRPVIVSESRSRVFPATVEREILDTFAVLSPGLARALLAGLVRVAAPFVATPDHSPPSRVSRGDVVRLVSYSSRAARDLALLETAASELAAPDEAGRASALVAKVEGRFRAAIGALHRLRMDREIG